MPSTSFFRWFNSPSRIAVGIFVVLALLLSAFIGGYLIVESGRVYDFSLHQKVSASAPLRLSFPAEMNHASVEENLTLPKGLDVTKAWDGNTLVLQPSAKLETGKTYVIRVDGNAKKSDDTALVDDLVFTFVVTGAPMVSAQIPAADTKNVPTDAEITLVFDRPVIPLTQIQGAAAMKRFTDWPVTISPAPAGRWRWLGTTTATYVPDKGLTLATKYTITVPTGIKTVSGDATEKDFGWSFETERPVVVSTEPKDATSNAGPTSVISVTFNQEMDLISAKDSIMLMEKSGTQNVKLPVSMVKYGTREERNTTVTDKRIIIVVPAKPLEFKKSYTIEVQAGIRGLVGDLGSVAPFTSSFNTVGEFSVVSAHYDNGMLQVDFANPVDGKAVKSALSFNPAVDMKDQELSAYETWFHDRTVYRVSIYPNLKPSTKYTFSLKQSLSDIYGQKLAKQFEYAFTTPALEPRVFIHPEAKEFSIFERGKPPVYFLNDVNVSALNLEFGTLNFDTFVSLRKSRMNNNASSIIDARSIVENYKTFTVKPAAKKNEWESVPLDVEKTFGALSPGLYLLTLKAPEWINTFEGTPLQEERIFAITNMAMTLKYSHGKALVWVTDLQTGEPVSGAQIRFIPLSGTVQASGRTDNDGFFETTLDLQKFKNLEYDWQPEFYVTAQKGDDFAFVGSNWNNGMQPYDFDGIYGDFRSPESAKYRLQSFLYTDRPLYGAGDTVYFKGILRFLDDNGKISLPSTGRSAHVVINDMNGTQVYSKDIRLSDFGSFNDSFTLAAEAPLGFYGIQATVLPESDVEGSAYGNFSVLAYRKPEYRVTVTPAKEEFANRETATVDVSGQYYFGAPMASAPVQWTLYGNDYFFNKYTEGWYSFALEDSWCWEGCSDQGNALITEGNNSLDASGRLKLSLPLNIDDKPVSQIMTLEANITDENNQVVSQRQSFVVHKSNVYVGIRSDSYGMAAGEKADIKIVTLKTDGSPAPGTTVDIKLYSRTWNVTNEKGVDGEYYYNSEPEDTFLRTQSAVTNEQGKATISVTLDEGGEYRVVATAKDIGGRESKASWSLYAWSDTYFNWPRTNNDRIDVITDKPEYKPGETAKLIVKSPYQGKGVKALLTVERENVITKKIIDVTSNAMPIEVPITEDLIPTAYVSVVIVKPRIGETFNENGLDTGSPAFKIGYAKLVIDTASKKLNVDIRTDKQKYLPGEKVNVDITVVDAKGNPVQADLSLATVDMSLLDLMGFEIPNLVDMFYAQRGLGVQTANMLTFLMERFKPGSKGGGGDGEDRTRGTFKDTAYWNPRILTDANGHAAVSFTLPDNLTTWQLLALGATKDTLVGAFAHTIIETKRVILRPVRPRFAVAGDQITLGAIVHNYLDEDREFTVTLTGKGFTTGKAEHKVFIAKDAQVKLDFPVSVQDTETMSMHFTATTEGAKDDIVETIPIHRFGVQQTNATANVTETQETEKVSVPTKADAPLGTLQVTLAPTLAIYLPDSLEFLSTFPYGCAEQVVSSFVPNVALLQLKGFEQFSTIKAPGLAKNIETGLQKLYTFQRPDGGFGYWEGSLGSYPYLTAYILDALRMTKEAGHAVDASRTDRAASYLRTVLRSGDLSNVDDETRAYALYVLSHFAAPDAAALNTAHKTRSDLALYSRAYLAMALANAGGRSHEAKAQEVLDEILSHVSISPRGAHFEEGDNRSYYAMNTDDRTTAVVLQAMVRIQPDHELVPRVIRGMLASRQDGHWDTTQSTAQSVLAFVSYLKQSNELEYNEQAAVEIDGKKKLDASFKAPAMEKKDVVVALSELPRGKDIDVKIGKSGQGKLYYDVILSYFYSPNIIPPAEEGIGIMRDTAPLTKADASLRVGTTQKVTLTMTVPETRHFVAVESMLPAGFEPIDLQFATSQQNLLENAVNAMKSWRDWQRNQTWRFTHIEYRDDRVFLFADELPPGVYRYEYLVRATTPGIFRERPARIFEMYTPEVFGQTEGRRMEIKP